MNDAELLDDLKKSLNHLEQALALPADNDVIKAGCIQYFEFCFELAWKSIQAVMRKNGMTDCLSPRSCLREAFSQGWIENEDTWLQMLEARNKMSHTYDTDEALRVYSSLNQFLPELKKLHTTLNQNI